MDALILHGIGSSAGAHWQSWLADALRERHWNVAMPNLPHADAPDREAWLDVVRAEAEKLDLAKSVLIGHSLGVTSALDFLMETTQPVRGFCSVAGFASDYGNPLNANFLRSRDIDLESARSKVGQAVVFYGDDDPWVDQVALREVSDGLRVVPRVFAGGAHLNTDAGFTEFPELLEAVLALRD